MRVSQAANRRILLGSGLAVVAAAAYGTGNVIAKKGMGETDVPPIVFTSFSLMFGMAMLSMLSAKSIAGGARISRWPLAMMMAAGVSSGCAVMFLVLGLDRATVTLVSPIVALNPIVTLVMAHFLLQRLERITMRVVLGTFLAVVGVVLVVIGSS